MKFVEEKAIVSHVEGEFVFLETQNKAYCENCSSKSGCGQVSSLFTFHSRSNLKVNNTLKLNTGDVVIVGMPSDKLFKATVLMYLLPLLLLFMFAFFAKLFISESASILAGLIGLIAGLLMVNKYSQQDLIAEQFQPKLVRKIINLDPA